MSMLGRLDRLQVPQTEPRLQERYGRSVHSGSIGVQPLSSVSNTVGNAVKFVCEFNRGKRLVRLSKRLILLAVGTTSLSAIRLLSDC